MNFEFVEFYPWPFEKKNKMQKRILGTAHVYVYSTDLQFDLRGIMVITYKNKIYFTMPVGKGIDSDTNKRVHFPYFGFSKNDDDKKFREFLSTHVEPIVRDRLKLLSKGEQ